MNWRIILIAFSIAFWVAFSIMATSMALHKEEITTISMKPKIKSKKRSHKKESL